MSSVSHIFSSESPSCCGAEDAGARWAAEPDLRETLLLSLVGALLFVATILLFKNYHLAVENFGDSAAYERVAVAIRQWSFEGLQIKQFWGYSYAAAVLAALTRLSDTASLLVVAGASSVVSVALAYRLWGGWIAAFFCILNFDWLQRSYLGGSEPLSVALIFGALLAVRRNRHLVAALLAALSTVVRPLGIFCLIAVGIDLLYKREYKRFAFAFIIGCIIAALYVLPFALHFGDPLATVHSYIGPERPLFGIPFYAIVEGTFLYPAPATNLILSFGWITLAVAGLLAMLHS